MDQLTKGQLFVPFFRGKFKGRYIPRKMFWKLFATEIPILKMYEKWTHGKVY
jgi:hypothetical protein